MAEMNLLDKIEQVNAERENRLLDEDKSSVIFIAHNPNMDTTCSDDYNAYESYVMSLVADVTGIDNLSVVHHDFSSVTYAPNGYDLDTYKLGSEIKLLAKADIFYYDSRHAKEFFDHFKILWTIAKDRGLTIIDFCELEI